MPTINFPKSELKRYMDSEVDDETLREALTMIGTDIDSFDQDVVVEVFPSRPDLLNVQGVARALNHFLGNREEVDTYDVKQGRGIVKVLETAANTRPHTRCAIVRGLDLDDTTIKHIIDIQEKLHVTHGRNRKRVAIGIYPLDKIRLPITFGGERPEQIRFRPLEAEKEMHGKEILSEHPTGKKFAHLLSGNELYPVFRDADGKVLSLPPVINSHDVGKVDVDTTEVFIECSGFDPKPLEEALTIICCALSDMGATVEDMTVQYPDQKVISPKLAPKKAKINREYVVSRAGIPDERLESALKRMGLSLSGDTLTIPCYRNDFLHDVDVVEDALIGYGYQNIEGRVPQVSTVGKLSSSYVSDRAVRSVLAGLGLTEVMNYFLGKEGVTLANPLNENYAALREKLLPGLLDVLSENTSNLYPQNIFELGTVFASGETETGVVENTRLSVLLCSDQATYTACRQMLEAVAGALGLRVGFERHESERFIPGRCAKIVGDFSGVIGEIHPQQLANRGVTHPAAAFEVQMK